MSKKPLLKIDNSTKESSSVKKLKKTEKQTNLNDMILDQLDKEVLFSFRTKESKREKIKRLAGINGQTVEKLMNDLMDEYIQEKQEILDLIDNVK